MPPTPIERRIMNTEHIDAAVMGDPRLSLGGRGYGSYGHGSYGGGSYGGGYGGMGVMGGYTGSYLSDVECHTCITRRVTCTRSGFRQIRPGYSECSRWLGGGGCGSGGMRAYDGEAASPCASVCGSPYRERLDPIAETSETPEMSGGLTDDDIPSSGYETARDSVSFLAADIFDSTQLDVCPTADKNKAEKTMRDVKALIDKDGNNRTWVLNIEELCRTECCRFKRTGSEGVQNPALVNGKNADMQQVLQKSAPHLAACKEACWKLNNCKGKRDCMHKPPVGFSKQIPEQNTNKTQAIRFFESLGPEYLEKIHSIRLQTKEATFLNPFEVASAIDLVIRTFPRVQHARIILHSEEDGEIEDKATIKLLVRTFRKLQRGLPLVEELRILGIEQHPRLMTKWSKNKHQKRSGVIRISYRLRGKGIRVKSKWTIKR